jgi:hypothetical protein
MIIKTTGMKKTIIYTTLLVIITLFLLHSCKTSQMITLSSGKQIDRTLVGNWKGNESSQQKEGMTKKWVFKRFINGDFYVIIEQESKDGVSYVEDDGKWWIQDGLYYEFHNNSGLTDVYTYQALNKDEIQFKSKSIDLPMAVSEYTYIDTRMKKNEIYVRDGRSFETAILVNSVKDEYEYIHEICWRCKPIQQALVSHKGKPYDVITIENQDGSTVEYYFDISSFYGKF